MSQPNPRSLTEILKEPKKDEGAAVFTKDVLKKYVDKCTAMLERMHEANADYKSALDAAEKAGIPKKELKGFIKHRTKKVSDEYKATFNIMCEMMGELPLFDFADTKH